MKKQLLTLLCLLAVWLPTFAVEKSYTIGFVTSDTGSDTSTEISASTDVSKYITAGAEYVTLNTASKVYQACKYGLKFSSSSANGVVTFDVAEAGRVNATKVVVNAAMFRDSEACKLALNDGDAVDLTTVDLTDYTFNLSGNDPLTSLKLAATKRLYVKSVTVYYEENETPAELQEATFTITDGNGNPVELYSEVEGPVTAMVTNPNGAGTSMDIQIYSGPFIASNETVNETGVTDAEKKYQYADAGAYYLSVVVRQEGNSTTKFSEFGWTIKKPVQKLTYDPMVEIMESGSSKPLPESATSGKAPVTMRFTDWNSMLGGSSKLYYFVTDEAADPDYTVASSYEATEVLTKPGEYRYKAIAQQFDEYNNLVAASGAVEGTFTVTSDQPAALKPATFVVKDAKGNDVVNEATVAEADGPVTITVTNPNADTSMDITLFDLNTENVVNSYIVIGSSEKVVEVSDPSSYVVSVVITRDPETANSEFMFTLEGTSQVVLNAPSVSFWGESDEFIDSATEADLPIDIIFTHDNWMNPQTEIVYSVNGGEEVVIEGYSAEYRITEPGEYAYSTYCRLGNVVSETTTGTFTVTAAAPTKATFAATDGNGDPVENNATVSVAPVTIVITNPAEGSAMDISVYNDGTGNSKSYASSDATYTIEVSDPGLNVVGVMVNDQYSEFAFTIEGEVEIPLTAPIVEFLDSDFNEVVSPADIADYGTILMSISHQNYMGAVEVVYTINGEEKVSSDYFTDIELTEPGTYEYSAYCRTSATNVSETVSGTFIITESEPGVKLNAPTITFSTPEGEDAPVTVTITNPNEEGTIVYTINDGAETAGEGNPVTFQLTEDGEYVVKAYVRNDADETLSSDVTTGNYSLSGIYAISFGAEGVKVIGGHIVAPEGAAVYNVNGVKVNTLDRVASGLYIVRLSNGTTAKVVVK